VLNQVFGKSYTFTDTGSIIHLTIGNNAAPGAAYWKGGINSAWNGTSGLLTNFTTDAGGTTNANQLVGATTNVFFTANTATNFSNTTLGQDFTINSLTFTGTGTSATSPVGIGGSNLLTINATNANGNTAGNGITVQTGSGNHTISSNVALGGNQTWTVTDAGNTLTASGIVSGSGFDLTKAGAGTLAFTGSSANTYSGLTTVNAGELDLNKSSGVAVAGDLDVAGGTAKLLGNNQISTGSNVVVSGGTLAMQGFNNTVSGVQLSGGSITGTGGTLTSTSNFDVQSGSASAILGGSVGLNKATSGTATLTGANTYTGATTIAASGGTLVADAANALGGTTGITVNSGGTLLISNSASTNHVNNTAPINQNGGSIAISTSVSEGTASTVTAGVPDGGTSIVGLGALTLTMNSILDFDSSGDGTLLVFSLLSSNNFVLTINGYTNLNFDGSLNSGLSTDDRLVFATSQAANFGAFDFGFGAGINVGQISLDNGFYEVGVLTPVPEPSTWAAAALALTAIVWTQRRRFIRNPSFVPIA
jgi:autotransporter-associated beta strand protein